MVKRKNWYQKSLNYWSVFYLYFQKEDATIDGVLGGYGYIHESDIKDSEKFIDRLRNECGMMAKRALGNKRIYFGI
jgi:hypothetical protein